MALPEALERQWPGDGLRPVAALNKVARPPEPVKAPPRVIRGQARLVHVHAAFEDCQTAQACVRFDRRAARFYRRRSLSMLRSRRVLVEKAVARLRPGDSGASPKIGARLARGAALAIASSLALVACQPAPAVPPTSAPPKPPPAAPAVASPAASPAASPSPSPSPAALASPAASPAAGRVVNIDAADFAF